jgi:hypothetical protein
MVVHEVCLTLEERHPVASQLVADNLDLTVYDVMAAPGEVIHGDVLFDSVALTVQVPLGKAC